MVECGRLNDGDEIGYASVSASVLIAGLRSSNYTGGDAGFAPDIIRFPEQHFTVAILANFGSIVPSNLARGIADIYLADVLQPIPGSSPSTFPATRRRCMELLTGYYAEPRLAGRVARHRGA